MSEENTNANTNADTSTGAPATPPQEYKPTREDVEKYLMSTDDGKALFSSLYDRRFAKSQANKAAQGAKASPAPPAADGEENVSLAEALAETRRLLKEQREAFDNFAQGHTRKELTAKVREFFASKKLPESIQKQAETFVRDDAEASLASAKAFAEAYLASVEDGVKSRLAATGYVLPKTAAPSDEDNLSDEEYFKARRAAAAGK